MCQCITKAGDRVEGISIKSFLNIEHIQLEMTGTRFRLGVS
jgi:hypothetical protein